MASGCKVVYKPNFAGIRSVLNGEGAQAAVNQAAQEIHGRACGMFGASNYGISEARPGKNRCHAIVYTADIYAIRSNALHQTLQKSIGH